MIIGIQFNPNKTNQLDLVNQRALNRVGPKMINPFTELTP